MSEIVKIDREGVLVVDGKSKLCPYDGVCVVRCALFKSTREKGSGLYTVELGCGPTRYEEVLGEYFDEFTDEIEGG